MAHGFKKGDRVSISGNERGIIQIIFPHSTVAEVLLDDGVWSYPLLTELKVVGQRQIFNCDSAESVPDATGTSDFDPQAYADWATKQFMVLPYEIKADGCDPAPPEVTSNCEICKPLPYSHIFTYACMSTEDGPEVDILRAYTHGHTDFITTSHALIGIHNCRRVNRG